MLQLILGAVAMVALIALHIAALYGIWWIALVITSRLPLIGRRHKHRDWERLNMPAVTSRPGQVPPS